MGDGIGCGEFKLSKMDSASFYHAEGDSQRGKAVITLTTLTHDPPKKLLRVHFGHSDMSPGTHVQSQPLTELLGSHTHRLFVAALDRVLGAEGNGKCHSQRPQIRNLPCPRSRRKRDSLPGLRGGSVKSHPAPPMSHPNAIRPGTEIKARDPAKLY